MTSEQRVKMPSTWVSERTAGACSSWLLWQWAIEDHCDTRPQGSENFSPSEATVLGVLKPGILSLSGRDSKFCKQANDTRDPLVTCNISLC
jgi:hypothetical protein